jgi:8-oxo-dGTP diphosphatase
MKQLNPHISVDCVIFGFDAEKLKVLLVKRKLEQNQKADVKLKLPGDLVYEDEDLDAAASRVLKDLSGLENIFLKQFRVFGSPDRISDKRDDLEWLQKTTNLPINRVVTIAYYSLVNIQDDIKIKSMLNEDAEWYDIYKLPELAFDHAEIVQQGLQTIRREMQYEPLEFELLPKKFTIRQLQNLYEIVFQLSLDSRNFRKKLNTLNYIISLKEKEKDVAHKPAQFFRFDIKKYQKAKQENLIYSL